MTQKDLDDLAQQSADGEYYDSRSDRSLHKIGYQAGFKKALELVLNIVSEDYEGDSIYTLFREFGEFKPE